jgi:hypothetical protein
VTIYGFWSSPAIWERLDAIWRADEQLRGLQIHRAGAAGGPGERSARTSNAPSPIRSIRRARGVGCRIGCHCHRAVGLYGAV